MKKTSFRRTVLLMLLMGLALALSACSSGKEEAPAQTAAPSGAPSPQRSGGAYSTMRGAFLLDSGVYDVLEKRCASTYMWTVPRDVLSRAALDLTGAAGEADGDETVYTVRVSANSAYTATGMDSEVLAAAGENGNADGEDADGAGDMVTDLMGDYVTTGGGEYVRTAVWRMKDGMSSGTAEITMSLNGEESGKERFKTRKTQQLGSSGRDCRLRRVRSLQRFCKKSILL